MVVGQFQEVAVGQVDPSPRMEEEAEQEAHLNIIFTFDSSLVEKNN